MKRLTQLAAVLVCVLSTNAYAQFGGLMDTIKKQAEQITASPKTEPAPVATNTNTTSNKSAAKEAPSNKFKPNQDTAFSCKINGKQLVYTNNLASDDHNISVNFNWVDAKNPENDFRTTYKEPMLLSINEGNKATITTYYFKIKQMTYAISHCDGMLCGNPSQPYWFTVFDNNKKVKQDDCDENTASDFNFPIDTDKKGNVKTQNKDVLIIKKSTLKLDPFN